MKVDAEPAEDQLRVLVIDDEREHAETVAEILEAGGYVCAVAASGREGAKKLQADEFDLVLTDLRMGDLDGLAIVKLVKELGDTLVMVISGSSDVKKAVQALTEGVSHYILKPVSKDELLAVVNKSADELRRLRTIRELRKQLDERFGFEGLIGNSPKMRDLIRGLKAISAHQSHGLDSRRERHRQGTGRQGPAHEQPAKEQAVRGHELHRAERKPARRRDVRPRSRERSPGRTSCARADSSTPTAALYSSTRLATCRRPSRPSCCACSKTAKSAGSDRTTSSRSMSDSSLRRIAIWNR